MKRAILLAVCLLAIAAPAYAQPRAPAGGMYVGGTFYKGGQFIPNSAGGFGMGGGGGGLYFMPMPPAQPYRPLTAARRLARVRARTTARTTASVGRTRTTVATPSFSFTSPNPSQPLPSGAGDEDEVEADGTESEAAEAADSRSDAIKLAEGRIKMAKNLVAIDKNVQAREWLELVVKMDASAETVKEAKDLLAATVK